MAENGPMGMYKIRPLYDFSPDISLPTCMYKLNNIYAEKLSHERTQMSSTLSQDELNLLEMEKHQLNIIQKLEDLKDKVLKMKENLGLSCEKPFGNLEKFQDIVVKANPQHPPLSLWIFYQLLSKSLPVRLVTYTHSSLIQIPASVLELKSVSNSDSCTVSLTIIWRDGDKDHEMMIDPVHQGIIQGEVNIARYISRILSFNYDTDPITSTQIDDWLETAHSLIIHGNNKERLSALRSLNSHLGKCEFLVGDNLTVADVVLWSSLLQIKLHQSLPANVTKWFKNLLQNDIFVLCKEIAAV